MGSDGEETPVVNHNSSTHSSENGVIGLSKVMDRMEDLSNCVDGRRSSSLLDEFISDQKDQQFWAFNRQLKSFVIKQVKRPGRGKLDLKKPDFTYKILGISS